MKTHLLQKSLQMIAAFPDSPNMFGRAEDYMELHSRNLSDLQEYVNEYQDDFLHKIVLEIPAITISDVADYIEDQNSSKGWVLLLYSGWLFAIFKLFKLVKAKGQTNSDIENKLRTISSKCTSIAMVLKNS